MHEPIRWWVAQTTRNVESLSTVLIRIISRNHILLSPLYCIYFHLKIVIERITLSLTYPLLYPLYKPTVLFRTNTWWCYCKPHLLSLLCHGKFPSSSQIDENSFKSVNTMALLWTKYLLMLWVQSFFCDHFLLCLVIYIRTSNQVIPP